MAAVMTTKLALAGPSSIAREQQLQPQPPLPTLSLKAPCLLRKCAGAWSSRTQPRLRWKPERNGLRRGGGRRCASASRVFATSAVEDEALQGSSQERAIDSESSAGEFQDMEDIEVEKGFRMSRVCDRLIEVFLVERTKPEDWRVLITFSKEWDTIRPYFFRRCDSQSKLAEDPKKKADLLKLARQMKEVDDDMQRHNRTLRTVRESLLELDAIVARHREDFTGDFFQHLHLLTEACQDDLDGREELATLASKCLIAVEAHDRVSEDDRFLDAAQLKFDDILSSPSLEAAAAKIDNLARTKQLDSTLMLLMTKAWASAKESTLVKDEAKDIMFYLYNVARENMARSIPKEIRIIRHLLSIEDPRERFEEMTLAFSPGDDLEGKEKDALYTKPEKLLKWINVVLDAFYSNKKGTLIKEAQNLLNPSVISRLEILRDVLEEQFL